MNTNIKDFNEKISENNGFIKTFEIMELGYSKRQIQKLIDEGIIERVKRGLYRACDIEVESELIDVSKVIPKGVLCLTSALSFYELTTYTPYEYQIAIDRRSKVTVQHDLPVKIYYFETKYYEMGISEVAIDGYTIKIYNLEKTLCDCVRYRNKIGQDIISEAFKEYIKRKDKDLALLMKYAKETRVAKTIKSYMEVLI